MAMFIVIFCFYNYGVVSVAIKKIGAGASSRTRKLVWQYFFAAILAWFTAVVTGQLEFSWLFAIVAIIGAANALGCYCQWRAYDISLARAAVMSNLDDMIAMVLGYTLLGELGVLTPTLVCGIVVSVVSTAIFTRITYTRSADITPPSIVLEADSAIGTPAEQSSSRLIGWVLGYSIIWGVAMFSMRWFSVEGMSVLTFVAAWYGGAWVGALLVFLAMGHEEAGPSLTSTQKRGVLLLAVLIWSAQIYSIWLRGQLPITILQPILLVAEMSLGAMTGIIFFGEAKKMSLQEIIIIMVALAGVAIIAISSL